MSLMQIFDVAGSGMTAQSIRMNTVASNMANAQSASGSNDEVYRARQPVFKTVQSQVLDTYSSNSIHNQLHQGVAVSHIEESQVEFERRYEPGHPEADDEGFVFYPNVNIVDEMANMISSSRSFQMNVDVMDAAKTMVQQVLSLGK